MLFAGRLSDPRLFATLLKLFFLPELQDNCDEDEDDNEDEFAVTTVGSREHMQQTLSVFFHAFFMAGDGREDVALLATPDLISDIVTKMRFENADSSSLLKVCSQLLSLCDCINQKSTEATRNMFKMRIFATVSREALKMVITLLSFYYNRCRRYCGRVDMC